MGAQRASLDTSYDRAIKLSSNQKKKKKKKGKKEKKKRKNDGKKG